MRVPGPTILKPHLNLAWPQLQLQSQSFFLPLQIGFQFINIEQQQQQHLQVFTINHKTKTMKATAMYVRKNLTERGLLRGLRCGVVWSSLREDGTVPLWDGASSGSDRQTRCCYLLRPPVSLLDLLLLVLMVLGLCPSPSLHRKLNTMFNHFRHQRSKTRWSFIRHTRTFRV